MSVFRESDSTSRLLSAALAGAAARRTFGVPARLAPATQPMSPELERLRQELGQGGGEAAAYAFLEHTDPESLAAAHRAAFGDQAGPVAAREALRSAWESYRHDRCRGLN